VSKINKFIAKCYKGIQPVSDLGNYIGMVTLFIMMVLTAVDVTMRKTINMPVLGSYELLQFLLAIGAGLGLAHCAVKKQHVVIDLFTSKASEKTNGILGIFTGLFSIIVGIAMTWQLFNYIMITMKSGQSSAVLMIPIWPFVAIVTFGFALYTVVLIIHYLEFIRAAISKEEGK
jgi:TRAP-type C4-dicarboxylate transport system permease small subunit